MHSNQRVFLFHLHVSFSTRPFTGFTFLFFFFFLFDFQQVDRKLDSHISAKFEKAFFWGGRGGD